MQETQKIYERYFRLSQKKERLSRLVDENNLLREHFQTAADELHAESGTYLLNLMRSLSKRDQLKFLTAQFSQTTSIIKHLLDDNDIKKSYEKSWLESMSFSWLLYVLHHPQTNTEMMYNTLLNLALVHPTLKEIRKALAVMLKNELFKRHLLLAQDDSDLNALFTFYRDAEVRLSEEEYLTAINHFNGLEKEDHLNSNLAICIKNFVLNTKKRNQLGILLDHDKYLLKLILSLSVATTNTGKAYFNPALLFAVRANLRGKNQAAFRKIRITIEAIAWNDMPIGDLLELNEGYLSNTVNTSPHLIGEMLFDISRSKKEKASIKPIKKSILSSFKPEPSERYAWNDRQHQLLRKAFIGSTHYRAWTAGLLDNLNDAFHLYLKFKDPAVTRTQFIDEAKILLAPLSDVHRLIVLHFKPMGARLTLKEIFMPDIEDILNMFYEKSPLQAIQNVGFAYFEHWLSVTEIPLIPILHLLFEKMSQEEAHARPKIQSKIEHLIITHTDVFQRHCKLKHLLSDYIDSVHTPNTPNIPLMLFLMKFPISKYTMSEDQLNVALETFSAYPASHMPYDEPIHAQVISNAITTLLKAGANAHRRKIIASPLIRHSDQPVFIKSPLTLFSPSTSSTQNKLPKKSAYQPH